MKITFQFDNGVSRIILEPESARDEQYISLVRMDGKPLVTVENSAGDNKSLVLKFQLDNAKVLFKEEKK